MRNLQLEVRQLRDTYQSLEALGASGTLILRPGQTAGQVDIAAQNNQRNDASSLVQRLLVLNGRSANIMLGNSVPLRLLHSFIHNGHLRYGTATVLVEANSGFSARPFWRGANSAELELSAVSSRQQTGLPASASTATTLVLPLNEWVTVAQSDQASAGNRSGMLSSDQSAARSALTVQVRVTVR